MLRHLVSNRVIRWLSGAIPSMVMNQLTRRYRSQKVREMPNADLQMKHLRNCRLLKDRAELLKLLPVDAVVAEIGVAYGDFTKQIIEITNPRHLHLIDLWQGKRYGEGLEKINRDLLGQIGTKQIIVNRGYSTQVLSEFPDSYFDWVYIDTDHTYATTRDELLLCHKKVNSDGIICGHDFSKGNVIYPVVYGVIQACNEFCIEMDYEYIYLTLESSGDFSFALRRRT